MTFRHDCQKCTTAFGMRYPCSEHGSQDPEHDPSCLCRDCCPAPGDPCTDCGEALRVSFVERGSVESGPKGTVFEIVVPRSAAAASRRPEVVLLRDRPRPATGGAR